MRRRLFSIARVLSVLLCAASVVLWVRSILVADLFRMWLKPNKEICLLSERGAFQLRFAVFTFPGGGQRLTHQKLPYDDLDMIPLLIQDFPMEFDSTFDQHWAIKAKHKEGQFDGFHNSLSPDFRYRLLVIPYWIVLAIVAIIPLRALRKGRPVASNTGFPVGGTA